MNVSMLQDPRLVSGDTGKEMLYWDNSTYQYKPTDNLTWDETNQLLSVTGDINITSETKFFQIGGTRFLSGKGLGTVFIGASGNFTTSGQYNFFAGQDAGMSITTGDWNIILGVSAGSSNTIGSDNIFIGGESGKGNISGGYNICIGDYAGYSLNAAMRNTMIGPFSGYLTTGSDNIFLGIHSGRRQTTNSNLLIIDNQDRSSAANELTTSLIYGIFNASSGSQYLYFNSNVNIRHKLTAGAFASPVDVTATREYGLELHYSGNDYNVTGIRSRAQLKTTDTTASAQGGLFQAANNDGINAGVLNGALIEAIGKSSTTPATIATMRAGLVNSEWDEYDTITDLKTLHVRTHTRNSATQGYISNSGYLIYLENEAVGGNGQALDAGIYFKDTNISGGIKAFDYGIDFSGGTYSTAEILMGDGSGYLKTAAINLNGTATFTLAATDTFGLRLDGETNPYVYSSGDLTCSYIKRKLVDAGSAQSTYPDELIGNHIYTEWNYSFEGDGLDLANTVLVNNKSEFFLPQPDSGNGFVVNAWTGKPGSYTAEIIANYNKFTCSTLFEIDASDKTMIYNLYGTKCEFAGVANMIETDGDLQINVIGGEFTANLNYLSTDDPAVNFYGGKFSATGRTVGTSVAYGGYFEAVDADTNYGIYVNAGTSYFNDNIQVAEAKNIVLGTTTGTKFGTATTQKIGFFNANPVSQRLKADYNNWAAFTDVVDALVALGLFDQA